MNLLKIFLEFLTMLNNIMPQILYILKVLFLLNRCRIIEKFNSTLN